MRRIDHALDALMPRTRQAVLAAVLLSSKNAWYRSDLARHLGVPPSSLTRELNALTNAGLLRKRTEGRHTYYEVERESPFFPELHSLMTKTAGLVDVLRDELLGVDRDEVAFVYGSWARGDAGPSSDIDVFVVSSRPLSKLVRGIRSAEKRLGRPVNVSLYSAAELGKKLRRDHHFVHEVVRGQKLFINGSERDLERIASEGQRRKASPRSDRTS